MVTYYTTQWKTGLSNIDTNITTQDELEELAVILCDKLMKAVDTSTTEVYNCNDHKSPISQDILDFIKEKCMFRQLQLSFLEVLKFSGIQFSVVHSGGGGGGYFLE